MDKFSSSARQVVERCRLLAQCTEEPGFITRTFLSEPMREVHRLLGTWMEQAGMQVSVDAAGNVRGCYPASEHEARAFYIGSHVDTVPHAGAFDGILGVILGIELVYLLGGRGLPFRIEVVAFSEEEGIRFSVPFIGSRALIGDVSDDLLKMCDKQGLSVREAILQFGLAPARVKEALVSECAIGYFEFHIEQGPVLENLNLPLGIVTSIAGQSRFAVIFEGRPGHAGTTPMHLRRDALAGAAEWIAIVEREARAVPGLVATIGRLDVQPGAANVIPGHVQASLDVRHSENDVRLQGAERLLGCGRQVAASRRIGFSAEPMLDQPAVAMDHALVRILEGAVTGAGYEPHRMTSGAGHDAMIMARRMPSAMLFLRSPGGISHHPDETVLPEDVAAALKVGEAFLRELENHRG